MMRRGSMLLGLLLFCAAGLAGQAAIRERDSGWAAPLPAASKANPLAGRRDVIAGGRKVFQQRCTTCHGDGGRGGSEAPDLTQAAVQMQSDGELFWKISSGNTREGMPAFSFLPEAQRWQLVMHLRELP
jgi:mono/diheme cytochrome c family protein